MYRLFLILYPLLAVVLSGCQMPGGKPSGAEDGYFTWVDEQGQVRQTRLPGSRSPDEDDGNEDTRNKESAGSGDHPEFNLENFPDGNALEDRGYVRPGDPEPYFTWRDAQGNVRVSYYQADTRTAVEKGEIQPPLQLTEASIYEAGADSIDADLPEGADPFASAILGLDDSEAPFFERWAAACCDDLERTEYQQWQTGREFGVSVEAASASHTFLTGRSYYRLIRLPYHKDEKQKRENPGRTVNDFILRLRSFDQKGLFVPSVAFLDDEFQPLRLVTDLVAEFVPESWYQHGFLRSHIPVFPSRGERWLLIFTTDEDIANQTVIDTRYGPQAIEHQPTGELGLARVEE